MEYRNWLEDDYQRLRAAATDLTATVPTCPGWTVADLVRHVAEVYLHKVACMRLGRHPEDWPPDLSAEGDLALLERGYRELCAEFDARQLTDETFTWYPPEQNVAFWHRRMALETAVHRVDAEMAGLGHHPVAEELALDGIDEFLVIMLAWGENTYGLDELVDAPTVEIRAGGRSWFVDQTSVAVRIAGTGSAATVVSGDPSDVLLWLWRRVGTGAVTVTGDQAGLDALTELLRKAGS